MFIKYKIVLRADPVKSPLESVILFVIHAKEDFTGISFEMPQVCFALFLSS